MDYDKIFEEDLNRNFFYTDYPGKKIMDGKISLENAKARLNQDEYYILVTYNEGDVLPKEYISLASLNSEDGTLFATPSQDINFYYMCDENGGIQRISRLHDLDSGSPNYLLGPGPDEIALEDLVMKQYEYYENRKNMSK